MNEEKGCNQADALHYAFHSPSFSLINQETQKPVYEMKRKTPGDQLYYIFKLYEENLPEPDVESFRDWFNTILGAAGIIGIPMYSFDEITEKSSEKVMELISQGIKITEKQIDVKIEIKDHATGVINDLTIGVNAGDLGK